MHTKILFIIKQFFILICLSVGIFISANNTNATNDDTLFKIITDRSTIATNDFFVKVHSQIIPIEPDSFSTQKTIVQHLPEVNYVPEIENIHLCPDDTSPNFTVCDITTSLQNQLNIRKRTIFEINKLALKEYLITLHKTSKKVAKNATLQANLKGDIIVTKKEELGYEIDIDKISSNLMEYFGNLPEKKVITLPTKLSTPTITSNNYKELGFREKIGSGKSDFRGSPKNRIHNIHVATGKFEGAIIVPNETFSFVKILGPVNEETGYKEELVIKNNETIPEFGGGICQVSTTLFRSAVNTGLEITERRHHAYPVQYYSPQGTDATVYLPKPDLQFINNTPGHILIQPRFNGTVLSFDIFGTSDGRQVITEGPTLLKRTDNNDQKYVWWQIVNDKDGKQISKKGFWSFYQDETKFHENEEQVYHTKPKDWSNSEWKEYKKTHRM